VKHKNFKRQEKAFEEQVTTSRKFSKDYFVHIRSQKCARSLMDQEAIKYRSSMSKPT